RQPDTVWFLSCVAQERMRGCRRCFAGMPPTRGMVPTCKALRVLQVGRLNVQPVMPYQSTAILALWITLLQRTRSVAIQSENSLGVDPATSAPRDFRRSWISGIAKASLMALLSFWATGSEVPGAATIPYQALASNPGNPAPAAVGTSGATGVRFLLA